MKTLFNIFNKKIFVLKYDKRSLSYRIRKSLCYLLSRTEIDESGETVYEANCFKRFTMSKCSKFEINVITNGSSETSSVFLDMGTFSYLFNCGENCGRARSELKCKSLGLHGIFITSCSWHNIGGLVGTLLTRKRSGGEFFVFGPPKIKEIISLAESKYSLNSLLLRVVTNSPKQVFDDGMMKIKFVPLYYKSTKRKSRSMSEPGADVEDKSPVEFAEERSKRSPSHSKDRENNSVSDKYVLNYICQSADFGHHLDFNACIKRNVPVGPLLQQLKNKQDITLENGEVVHWKDVSYSTSSGPITIIFADCPSSAYLDSLLNEKEFAPCQSLSETPANLIIHFTQPKVMQTEKYRQWMSLFPSSTNHLIVNSDNSVIDLLSSHDVQKRMNYLSPSIFPSLFDEGLPVLKEEQSKLLWKTNFSLYTCRDEEEEKNIVSNKKFSNLLSARDALVSLPDIFHDIDGMNVVRAIPGLSHSFHPRTSYEWHFYSSHHYSAILHDLFTTSEVESAVTDFRAYEEDWMRSDECLKRPEYPKLIFLGTGSGEPATRRSASAIMLYLNPNEIILLDCGEGTYMQMCRLFGPENIDDILQKIILVFVSHHHVDHHIGLYTILSERIKIMSRNNMKTERKLVLMLPIQVKHWLVQLSLINQPILQYSMIVNNDPHTSIYKNIKEDLIDTDLGDISICNVIHCSRACGISVTHKNGYKITYSGDAMPSDSLVQMGKDSNILIHEATFEDDLEKMAHEKKHSTVTQAIQVGMKMKAKHIVLTHFSQRYWKVPRIDYESLPKNVAIAFDFMIVNERVLPLMEKLNLMYGKVFARELLMLEGKMLNLRQNLKRDIVDHEFQETEKDQESIPSKIKRKEFL